MVEEKKKEFKKTTELGVDEVRKIINTDYGVKLTLKDIKTNHHLIMKILEPVVEDSYEFDGDTKKTYTIKCRYGKGKGIKPVELQVQVGENAINRLREKYPEDSYVDKYAFFTKTKYGDGYPQFINVIPHYEAPQSKEELFSSEDEEGIETPVVKEGEEASPPSSLLNNKAEFKLSETEKSTIKELQEFKGDEAFTKASVKLSFITRLGNEVPEDRMNYLIKKAME